MRPPGAALGPDAVLVWMDDREVTRFERAGTRSSFTLPFTPLASRIGSDAVFAVDARGSVHRFSLAGEHLGFVPLLESPGTISHAAVSADGSRLAILVDEVHVFEHGQLRAWAFEHRRSEGWRERGLELSADGSALLVRYETSGDGENLGGNAEGFSITRADGLLLYRHFAQSLPPLELAMSFDARYIAICEHEKVRIDETGSMAPIRRIEPVGHVQCMRFSGPQLGVLYDYELVLGDQRLQLPERFDDFVFCGRDVVCVHPELGAWWIDITPPAR